MDKVLITGGAGFIGSHLCRLLIEKGFHIRILDSLAPQIHGTIPTGLDWLNDHRIEFIRGSVTSRIDLENSLKDISHIVHLAAETGTGQSMYEISRYNFVNSQGTALLLDILANQRNHSIKRFILASSRSVYGEGAYVCYKCDGGQRRLFPKARPAGQLVKHQWDPICPGCGHSLSAVPTREDDPVLPASIYAATKYTQEDLVRIACESLDIGFAILRLQNVYGEEQSLQNPYTGILSIFSTRIRRGLELPIFEDGLETRDFVHVSDVVRAMLACLVSMKPVNSVINVGSGVATTVHDVALQLIRSLNGSSSTKITCEYRLGDIRHNVADISRLRLLLPDAPCVSLEKGLNKFSEWVKNQPLPEDGLDRANAELRARNLMA
ncbi:NAD-dependent epimerase/dehydratase family protein [Chromobacterium piscinae]|uniref:NAD-dependent epimerase/dehydratase family protein n=1 Tax=Chromobacterium piscinae TaxID=686831 RepID=A0ABV0H0E3_9NEIS